VGQRWGRFCHGFAAHDVIGKIEIGRPRLRRNAAAVQNRLQNPKLNRWMFELRPRHGNQQDGRLVSPRSAQGELLLTARRLMVDAQGIEPWTSPV
jgi:hypothetical protein